MSNLEDLAKIQQAIGALQSNDPITELQVDKLIKEANISSALPEAELIRIGKTQADISQVLGGETLDFGTVTRLSDCIKNIDDVIIDRLKRKLTSLLLQNNTASSAIGAASSIMNLVNLVNSYITFINELKDKSFLELLILAKNAGLLERIELFRQIQEKYGNVISNLNNILDNIDSLNICNMIGLGGGPIPSGVKQNMKPEALPDFGTIVEVNNDSIEKKQKYEDVISRIGFEITNVLDFVPTRLAGAINSKPSTPPVVNDALSHLQNFSRAVINRYGTAEADEVTKLRAIFNMEIDRKLDEYSHEWTPETREFYRSKAQEALNVASAEQQTLRDWNVLKSNMQRPGEKLDTTGITVYGPASWDLTSYLDLAPNLRPTPPPFSQARIDAGLESLRKQKLTPGTLQNISDQFTGAYNKTRLVSGYSCASSRWPGGTKLQLRNPDGSIYDPAGLNPTGIVTVVDTGPVTKETWLRPDIFVENADDAKKYIKTSNRVEIFMVEIGTDTSNKKYRLAQNKNAQGWSETKKANS